MTPILLSETAGEILASVVAHRLLSTDQVHRLHVPSADPRWARRLLGDLERAGYLGRIRGRPPGRQSWWFALDAAFAAVGCARRHRLTPALAAGPLAAHTAAVNEVGIAFVGAARDRGDECGPADWVHEVPHRLGHGPGGLVLADAVLHYTVAGPDGDAVLARFVEVDRATATVAVLGAKLRGYARLLGSGAWAEHYPAFPRLVVVLAGTRRDLRRRAATVCDLARADAALAPLVAAEALSVVLLTDLVERGPWAPVFRRPDTDGVDLLGRPPAMLSHPPAMIGNVTP